MARETPAKLIEMRVNGLAVDPFNNMPIVVLKNEAGNVALPVWIGLIEAAPIASELEQIEFSRPMTHDLFAETLRAFSISASRIEIVDLVDNVFHARIVLSLGKESLTLDARPSDAIALALRLKSPIFVSQSVVEKARLVDMSKRYDAVSEEETWAEILENLPAEDFGKYKM